MAILNHLSPILATLAVILHWGIIVGLGFRIILKRRPTGVSLAWFFLISSVPFFGAFLYLLVGELWLPHRRIQDAALCKAKLARTIRAIEDHWEMLDTELPELARPLNAQTHVPLGISATRGNRVELFNSCSCFAEELIRDIDTATQSVCMLFYIWDSAGEVRAVEDALGRAAERGVDCRLLLDGAGCRSFLRSKNRKFMEQAGVRVTEALPVGLFRFLFRRIDIRNHRKIVTIDHHIAYTGSMNMVDPAFFQVKKGVGRWVDVMARISGPAARVLDITLALDWAIEDNRAREDRAESLIDAVNRADEVHARGGVAAQIVPSGPDQQPQLIHDMLLTLLFNARERVVITTPYLIPSEPMLNAIIAAAHRGVRVSIVVPENVDSILVRHASKAYYEDLFDAGVEIWAFQGGLLHSKTVTADDSVAMLGTVNMDKRSFWINFEISLFVYHSEVVEALRSQQREYIRNARRIEPAEWAERSFVQRVIQNTVQLFAPIL